MAGFRGFAMSAVSAGPVSHPSTSNVSAPHRARLWIINSWVDQFLILLTPLVATPAVLLLSSPWVGVRAETISVIVAAFFATATICRADRATEIASYLNDFVGVFSSRATAFLTYFPLSHYHGMSPDHSVLGHLAWADAALVSCEFTFLSRIDLKATALGLLVCLCGLVTPQLFAIQLFVLNHCYSSETVDSVVGFCKNPLDVLGVSVQS
jgi:hypothetical protein